MTARCARCCCIARVIQWQLMKRRAGTHKVKVYVVGTAGHPRVDVDAWIALK